MQRYGFLLALLAPLAVLAGCATTPAAMQVAPARLAAVHAAAGQPVSSFNVTPQMGSTTIYSWQALSNHELLVYTRPREAWLLGLTPCPRLFRTPFISLSSFMGQVDGFSSVRVFRSGIRCNVKTIRPVDVAKLKVHMVHRTGVKLAPRTSRPARRASPHRVR